MKEVNDSYSKQLRAISETIINFNKQAKKIISELPNLDLFLGFDQAGLTPNLGKSKSIHNVKKFISNLDKGYAIFWIPRADIVDEIVFADTSKQKKEIIIENQKLILSDCLKVVKTIKNNKLKNHADHLMSAITCMEHGNFRAAQSTATICLDSLIDELVDLSDLDSFRKINNKLNKTANVLTDIDKIPINYLYAALQSRLIIYLFRPFDRLNPNKISHKYARHSSTHSVSKRQYKPFNAMQAIMIATSLLATTNKLGSNWLSKLASYNSV